MKLRAAEITPDDKVITLIETKRAELNQELAACLEEITLYYEAIDNQAPDPFADKGREIGGVHTPILEESYKAIILCALLNEGETTSSRIFQYICKEYGGIYTNTFHRVWDEMKVRCES